MNQVIAVFTPMPSIPIDCLSSFYINQSYTSLSLTKATTTKARRSYMPLDKAKEVLLWRKKAHLVFDKLFEGDNPTMNRNEAYDYLQYLMGIDDEQAHISMFSIEQCQELIDLLDFAAN